MRIRLKHLNLTFKQSTELISFADFSYFFGELGAGKSTIARLIDYCLGANSVVMTPALQNEFVAASLLLDVEDNELNIERERDSNQVLASWGDQQVVIPTRTANGVVVPDTKVEVLSDLVFFVAGLDPPRVRRSQLNDESGLERLSIRDLLWYCYLDQDSMDSSFFHLDRDADNFKRLKSRNVLRSILGVHQELVAELEQRLDVLRRERQSCSQSAHELENSLLEVNFSSIEDIEAREQSVADQICRLEDSVKSIREENESAASHLADVLREQARQAAWELEAIERSVAEIESVNADDRRHRNEILALSTKVRRLESARAVLNDVEFLTCPRCTASLPERKSGECAVCGQSSAVSDQADVEGEKTQADIANRIAELEEMMESQATQLRRMRSRRNELQQKKNEIDSRLVEEMRQYDSAYLADAIDIERQLASNLKEREFLSQIKVLPARVESLKAKADALAADEASVRRQLKDAREAAEQDLTNVDKLKTLFLDCLLRARVPGFEFGDIVELDPPWFLPVIQGASGEIATTSFGTLGSGGKKNLFKCCFALAIHRLSAELGTLLPSLLIIDSPMKNISERENREQFEGFHQLLYELAAGELVETQFVLVDKEFCPPEGDVPLPVSSRHMKVDSVDEPPLIPYYRGK